MNKKIILLVLVCLLLIGCSSKKDVTEEDVVKYINSYFDDEVKVVSILDDTSDNNLKQYTIKSKKGFDFKVDNKLDKFGNSKYLKTTYLEALYSNNSILINKLYNKYSVLRINKIIDSTNMKTIININTIDGINTANNFLYEYYPLLDSLGIKYKDNKDMITNVIQLANKEIISVDNNAVINMDKNVHLELMRYAYLENVENGNIELKKKNLDKLYKKYNHVFIKKANIKDNILEDLEFIYSPNDKEYIVNSSIIEVLLKNMGIKYTNKNNIIKYSIGNNNYEISDKEYKLNNKKLDIKYVNYPIYYVKKDGNYIKISDLASILEVKSSFKEEVIYFK